MKKITGVIAILLSIAIFLIYRQLTSNHSKEAPPKTSVRTLLKENILLSSLLIP